jgi:hypothetical protein
VARPSPEANIDDVTIQPTKRIEELQKATERPRGDRLELDRGLQPDEIS